MTATQEHWAYRIAYVRNGEQIVHTFNYLHELRQLELYLAMSGVPIVSITCGSLFVTPEGELVERWKFMERECVI